MVYGAEDEKSASLCVRQSILRAAVGVWYVWYAEGMVIAVDVCGVFNVCSTLTLTWRAKCAVQGRRQPANGGAVLGHSR